MKPKVYIETTVVSYLTARPTRDVVRLSHEMLTRDWWVGAGSRFDLYTSPLVIQEASAGDTVAAAERLNALRAIPVLGISDEAIGLSGYLAARLQLPERARADALHVAIAAVNGIEFLVTWNCRHLANAVLAPTIEGVCDEHGRIAPRICTPEQLLEVT